MVTKNHHRRRADKAVVRLQGIEIERDIAHGGGQNTARCAAWQVGVEIVAILHATAEFSNQFLDRNARRCQMHAGYFHATRDRE